MAGKDRMFAVCGDGELLELLTVQPLGSRRMSASDYLRGHPVEKGASFDAQKA